tara:strand:+ start:225 stop:716 length:492 start_codon:yes stop_codon:yes gene_type:complete
MKKKRNKIGTISLIILCLVACDANRVYDSYVSISNQSWEKEKAISFSFNVKDTIQQRDLFINIRNNNSYAFSNLFLITELNFPNGKKIVDTLEYEMADSTGRFLGAGFTEIKENKLFYKEKVVFPTMGYYKISISQAMRKNGEIDGVLALEGITEVGFRIEKN